MKRTLQVLRIQAVNWPYLVGWPLGILVLTLGLNLAIFATAGDAIPQDSRISGALMSVYFTVAAQYFMTLTQLFPFAVGLSVTRKVFYASLVARVTVEAVAYGLLLLVLSGIERATGGWGLRLQFFALEFLRQDNLLLQWLAYAVPFLAVSMIAVVVAVVFKRWGQTGVFTTTIGAVVLSAGAVLLVSWQGWWDTVGSFFATQSTLALFAGYPVLIALVLAAVAWQAMRRATP